MPNFPPALPLPWTPVSRPEAVHHHVVLPYAALQDDSCQHVLRTLHLPHLEQLLHRLSATHTDTAQTENPIPPHERALARLLQLSPQQPAWAALGSATADTPCAWLTPCHWTAGADQVRLDDPTSLQLDWSAAQALRDVLDPWFAEDGLALEVVTPLLWRISGAPLTTLQSASLDRVFLRDASRWLPSAAQARLLHRLHSEVQMLLYTHPYNDARAQQGLLPVNAFWLHGSGSLSAQELARAQHSAAHNHVQVLDRLRQTALRQDWPAWQQAWSEADAGPLAALVQHLRQGGQASLHLCGEHHARSWSSTRRSVLQSVKNALRPTRFADLHQAL